MFAYLAYASEERDDSEINYFIEPSILTTLDHSNRESELYFPEHGKMRVWYKEYGENWFMFRLI